ncbi:MAG: Sec-independent protein translocase protein TatB [Acidaminococcaceae bacterium]
MSIGLGEIMIVLIVGFLVVGPEDLPKIARTLASWLKRSRAAMKDLTKSFEDEIDINDVKKNVQAVNSEVERMQREVLLHAEEVKKAAAEIKEVN